MAALSKAVQLGERRLAARAHRAAGGLRHPPGARHPARRQGPRGARLRQRRARSRRGRLCGRLPRGGSGRGGPPAAAQPGRHQAASRRRGVRRGDRRLGRRRSGCGRDPRRGGARRPGAGGRPAPRPRQLPPGSARGPLRPVPRRRADRLRGPPRHSHAGRPGGRGHHRHQLRHVLSSSRARAGELANRARHRLGAGARARLPRGRGDARRDPGRPADDGAKRPAPDGGRGGHGRRPRAASPKRRPLRVVQLVPAGLPPRRQARHAHDLPAARGGRGGAGARGRGGAAHRLRGRARHGRRVRHLPAAGSRRRQARPPGAGAQGRDHGRRRLRHSRAACCDPAFARPAASWGETSGSTPPAGWARGSRRRSGAGTA